MSTEQPHTPDRSVLGESWVVPSISSIKERSTEDDGAQEPASPGPDLRSDGAKIKNTSESLTSSSWSISGPELVMPSITEVSLSEASWVAPRVRDTNQSSLETMRKRQKISTEDKEPQREQRESNTVTDAGTSTPAQIPGNRGLGLVARLASCCYQSSLFRTIINVVLVVVMLHLLVIPELIYQARDLCQIPVVPSLYPSSCVSPVNRSPLSSPFHYQFKPTNPEKSIVTAQTRLESVLGTTLKTLTPLSDVLKQSENMVRDLQNQLKTAFPEAKNALTLEFKGSDQAIRAAAWEFDSLRADLRSAVDSLLSSPPALQAGSSVARDTRLATQLRRREQYLDRLRSQIRRKAEALGSRLTTLDDHLEAVAGIVTREQHRMRLSDSATESGTLFAFTSGDNRNVFFSLLDSLQHFTSFFFRPHSLESSMHHAPDSKPAAMGDLLRRAAGHHRPVTDSVRHLSRQLRDTPRVPNE